MSAPTNHWKLGLFVVVGFALALGTVAWLGAQASALTGGAATLIILAAVAVAFPMVRHCQIQHPK